MSDVTINVVVSQSSIITADFSGGATVNTSVESSGELAATITGGGTGPKGDQGDQGIQGIQGIQGATGAGTPSGGTTGQVIRKASNTNYDFEFHTPVKADIGLGNVDNTSDANKPISTATQTALDAKQPLDSDLTAIAALDSSTSGAIASDGAGWIKKTYAQFKTALGLVKADVGLGNVDNTSDVNKPVSTAQAAADAAVAAAAQPLDSDLTTIAGLTPTTDNVIQSKAGAWASRTLAQLLADLAGLGTTFQPLDSDLTTIAGLTPTTDNFMVATASAWASRTPTQARSQLGLGSIALLSTITEANITLADNTTNDFSTTKHGFVPKGPNLGKFLKDDGTWASIGGGGDALTSNPLSQFASTTSLQLKGVISDETGSGALVFANSPALVTPTGIVKGDVGLGNVDNTADTAKPVSTAQQTALDLKANLAGPTFTGDPKAPTPTAGDNDTSLATTAFVQTAIAPKVDYLLAQVFS